VDNTISGTFASVTGGSRTSHRRVLLGHRGTSNQAAGPISLVGGGSSMGHWLWLLSHRGSFNGHGSNSSVSGGNKTRQWENSPVSGGALGVHQHSSTGPLGACSKPTKHLVFHRTRPGARRWRTGLRQWHVWLRSWNTERSPVRLRLSFGTAMVAHVWRPAADAWLARARGRLGTMRRRYRHEKWEDPSIDTHNCPHIHSCPSIMPGSCWLPWLTQHHPGRCRCGEGGCR